MHGERWTVWVEARRTLSFGRWVALRTWAESRDVPGVRTTERMFHTLQDARKDAARRVLCLPCNPFFEFGAEAPPFHALPFEVVTAAGGRG